MRITSASRIHKFARIAPKAKSGLEHWLKVAKKSRWHSLQDVRRAFPHADMAKVKSGRKVIVFNIMKNSYRLITAIHFTTGRLFVLDFLTHADYGKDHWKGKL